MKKTIIFLFVLVSFVSCTKSQKINNNTKNKQNMPNIIENILRKQLLAGYSENEEGLDGIPSYTYTNQDMEVNLTLSENILKNQGYKFISEQEFQDKVKRVFDFSNEKDPINFLIEYPCSQKKYIYQLDINYVMSNNSPIYLYSDKRILVEPLFIPELIDYKKEYPQVLKEETLIPEKRKNSEGFNLRITKWKDITDLSKQRQKNIEILVHRNKYLFNDNKASLAWLKFNDEYFLESLVKTFGYVEDKDLVKWVIDKTLPVVHYIKSCPIH